MIPAHRPRLNENAVCEEIERAKVNRAQYPLVIVGIRGYYLDAMGKAGVNDRGIYDDAMFIVSPTAFATFNANTDPSKYRKGKGRGKGKGMATLKPGFWPCYRFDHHKGRVLGYPAICQRAGQVTVIRDGSPAYEDTGDFGINIHRGGRWGTSSEGCQTIPKSQWPSFYSLAKDQAQRLFGARWNKVTIPYLLVDEQERRAR
jgi:hypothetical protein